MSKGWRRGAAGCGSLALCLLALGGAAGQDLAPGEAQAIPTAPLPAQPLSLDGLTRLSWPVLEQLYRQSEAGTIREGYARGRAIYCPDSRLAGVRSRMTRALWHGKVFDAAGCFLVNQWCGFRAIKARVSYGQSWLDGRPSIIMDYSETSRVWADVRDEIREVAPGLYLGLMYRRRAPGPEFQFYFALEACPAVPAVP